jgi:polysaccharide biosynthesis protein PslG
MLRNTMKQKFSRPLVLLSVLVLSLVLGTVVYIAAQPAPDPFNGAAITDPAFPSLTYSVQTFVWWDEGSASNQLGMVDRVLNFSHIKQIFGWRDMELAAGDWDFTQSDRIVANAEEWKLRIVARLGLVPEWAAAEGTLINSDTIVHDSPPADLAVWANYCGTVAERYQGRIAAYQIWNEPNLAREWGGLEPNAGEYLELLAACSEAIRAVDKDAILISAGLAPTGSGLPIAIPDDVYLDALYRLDFQQYIDVVGAHATGYDIPGVGPDDAAQTGRGRYFSFRRIEDLRKIMLLHDDAARQMAILEFGYTTDTENEHYSWFAVTEEEQAQYTVEAYQYAAEHWRPWVGLMSLIYMPNPRWTSDNEEWWWAVGDSDGNMRPVFFALAQMDKYCGNRIVSGWPPTMSQEEWDEQRDTCP